MKGKSQNMTSEAQNANGGTIKDRWNDRSFRRSRASFGRVGEALYSLKKLYGNDYPGL
jgi:hypothetical protein